MGADVIYLYKKMLPRFFLVFLAWFVILVVFSSILNVVSWPIWLAGSSAFLFLYAGFEYFHASKLVKGNIENVSISDLTKAIYWLSIVGSKEAPSQEFSYQRNVNKVINRIDGELKADWEEILRKYKLPDPMRHILLIISMLASSLGTILLVQIPYLEWLSNISTGLTLLLLLAFAIAFKKGREHVESLVKSAETTKRIREIAQELISWASQRTKKPIQVMLAEGDYADAQIVSSMFGTIIAEIQPRDVPPEQKRSDEYVKPPESKEYKPYLPSFEKWEPLWLTLVLMAFISSIVLLKISIPLLNWIYMISYGLIGDIAAIIAAIAVVSLPFIPIELLFRKKHLPSSILILASALLIFLGVPTLEWLGFSEKMAWTTVFGMMIIVSIVLFIVILYLAFPFLKIISRGGKIDPSDIEGILRRLPARAVRSVLKRDSELKQRFDFLITLYCKGVADLSDVPEPLLGWIDQDRRRHPDTRFFILRENSVSLTYIGQTVAKMLQKKLKIS